MASSPTNMPACSASAAPQEKGDLEIIYPESVGIKIFEYLALHEKANGVDEQIAPDGYHINLVNFMSRWDDDERPHIARTARRGFLNARVHNVAPVTIYLHPSSHAYTPGPGTAGADFGGEITSFAFLARLEIHIESTSWTSTSDIISKAFAVCPVLVQLDIILRGINDSGNANSPPPYASAKAWLETAERALRNNTTVRIKTLDICPLRAASRAPLRRFVSAPYHKSAPRRVRIGAHDERSYLEQVNPCRMQLAEYTPAAGKYLVDALLFMRELKLRHGYAVENFSWEIEYGQRIEYGLQEAAYTLGPTKAFPSHLSQLEDALKKLIEEKEINRLHWRCHELKKLIEREERQASLLAIKSRAVILRSSMLNGGAWHRLLCELNGSRSPTKGTTPLRP